MLSIAELTEDIQAEIGEASSESIDLSSYLSDAESCETPSDLLANLQAAKTAAETILSNIKDQLARLESRDITASSSIGGSIIYDCSPVDADHEFEDDCEKVCDQLGNGCTCDSCTKQIESAGI